MISEIKTEKLSLILRLLEEEDAEELFWRNDQNRAHLRQWMPFLDETKSASDTLNFIRRTMENAIAGTQFHYALLLDNELVGVVAFNSIEKLNHCATLGYWLAHSKMGRGYMTAAAKALIDEGFQQLQLNRIQARVATANYPSQAVCDRLGLKKEGILRHSLGTARWLTDDDDEAVHALRENCAVEEWERGGSKSHSTEMVGAFKGHELAALASYQIWGEKIAHIAIVTHPAFRGQGYATAAVSCLTLNVLARMLVPQYRTLEGNAPSMAVASRLGFIHYGTSLALRFASSGKIGGR